MRRLRTTFRRSRTPTGADMKTQSSLEVPKQVRSASFDEIQLESQRSQQQQQHTQRQSSESGASASLLKVPQLNNQRSRSFDSAGSDDSGTHLEVPRRFPRRRSSSTKTPPPCVHCYYQELWDRQQAAGEDASSASRVDFPPLQSRSSTATTDSESENDDDDDFEDEVDFEAPPPSPNITVTLSPTCADFPDFVLEGCASPRLGSPTSPGLPVFPPSPTIELPPEEPPPTQRRRSISRQEAFFVEPTGSSLENVSGSDASGASSEPCGATVGEEPEVEVPGVPGLLVRDIYLTVPDLKRDRAASVDSCFSKVSSAGKTEELQPAPEGLTLVVPAAGLRSRSVDIVLPTSEQARYKALALAAPQPTPTGELPPTAVRYPVIRGKTGPRELRCTPDWGEAAVSGDHLWSPTSVSGDCCYVGDQDCTKHGPRMKCSACKIIAHSSCIDILMDRVKFMCKPTFRDVGVRQYREQTTTHHHWVHRRSEKGKCRHCGKSLQAKLSFSSKEIVALSCSWCKAAYHNKEACFNMQRIGEECNLGSQSKIIVPPSWIVKLPRRGSFKSSLRKSPKKKAGSKKKPKDSKTEQKTFVIKPIPTTNVTPVIVFINPKSGGNQGAKLLQKFQWLLNPRQVFDLTQGGPGPGLELFRKVPNMRVLACGGDGTVGWVLSVLDRIGVQPPPAVGVLPLGTGNDLARALGWGGGYEDEPISKILANIGDSDTVLLDRWELKVDPNPNATDTEQPGKPNLPLNVVNNYFSFGVDAHIALEFHEAREAHPEKFNSRIRNKLFYGTAGGKDLMQRKWKGLAELVTLECDGRDLTPKLKEHRVHAIVFLNIPSYGGGTRPWNKSGGTSEPSTEDGLIEVVGLTTYQLPLLQAGGHGTCITQCKTAKIVTSKTIPMQVDGEACKLAPSIITLSRLNQATMLAKRKPGRVNVQQTTLEQLKFSVHLINMSDYEQHHYDKELLKQAAECIGNIEVNPIADLEQVRGIINNFVKDNPNMPTLTPDWCFVDSCTAERFFRVDRAQENLHYVSDIGHECLFVLDTGIAPLTPDTETTNTGPSESSAGPMSFDTTTGQSISLDISHSVDTPSAGVSLDVPESHNSESGLGSPAKTSELLSPGTPQSPVAPSAISSTATETPSAFSVSQVCPSSPAKTTKEEFLLRDTITHFKSSLLEKTSDAVLKAAKIGDLKMLKELHAAGYSLLSIDANGQTALHIGARYGHKDIVKYLLACAPSSILNMQDNDKGQTALHKAAAHKRRAVCCLLVAGGAALLRTDFRGHTPRHLALLAEDHDLAAYLESQENFQVASEDLETVV